MYHNSLQEHTPAAFDIKRNNESISDASRWSHQLVNHDASLPYDLTTATALDQVSSLKELLRYASLSNQGVEFVEAAPSADTIPITRLSYNELLQKAEANSHVLRKAAKSMMTDIVLIHFDSIRENIDMFWAVVFADLLPVISTPLPADLDHRALHLNHLKNLLKDPLCLTSVTLVNDVSSASSLRARTFKDLKNEVGEADCERTAEKPRPKASPAVLMLTSGSTGNAKAVSLTFEQMLASNVGKVENWKSSTGSVFLNWIGLDHVANLVEIHMQAMLLGAKQVHVESSQLLQDPLLFLRLIDAHRVNYAFAPNFFLALLNKEMMLMDASDSTHNIDLSCICSVMSGGEANAIETANELTTRLKSLGAQGQVIRLGFGMTESCAACVYGMLDPIYEAAEKHQFASVGYPIKTVRVRITIDDRLADLYEHGNLELSGPAVFKEYFNNPQATREAFTCDEWFQTGDRAYLDSYGKINLVGRQKEILNINGVKFAPVDVETLLEKANLPHVLASYFAIFSNRSQDQPTESYCVVYGTNETSPDAKIRTVEEISRISSSVLSVRPNWVIPLSTSRLGKSSLGKLSRTKLQQLFYKGAYDDVKIGSSRPLLLDRSIPRISPQTVAEEKVVEVLSGMVEVPIELISTNATIFELGVTSVSLFRFERLLRRRFELGKSISVITFLSNPTISAIANAIENKESKIYNPVAQIQSKGSKTPLWLCHPASGNVLAFLPLARVITDRPLYALTARGLRHNESPFTDIAEMCDTYFEHVKRTQPKGPYALTGYSLGTTVAFELAKRLEANRDEIAFCASLDSPPHVIPLVEHLDWTAAAVLVSYFLELIAQDEVPGYIAEYRGLSQLETVQRLLDVARPAQRQALNLDAEQLLAIVNVTDNFGTMAKKYHPVGTVKMVDVFYCTPLHSIENSRESWIEGHLSKWQDFSRDKIQFHECDGDHADMLNPTFVGGFEKRLRRILEARGV